MRTPLLAICAALLVACGGTSGANRSTSPMSTVPPPLPTTVTTTMVIVQPAPPLDPEGARCQQVVNALVASWPHERIAAPVACEPYTPGEGGHYDPGTNRAVVGYDARFPDAIYRGSAAHELGHAWDDAHFESAAQRAYLDLRGFTGRPWAGPVEEDYAEVFAIATGETVFRVQLLAPIPPGLIETLRAKGLLPD